MTNYMDIVSIPYAGGNKYSYNRIKNSLENSFNLISLEYPGRGDRMHENLNSDVAYLTKDLVNEMCLKIASNSRYVLFGHSMGGILAYEMCHYMVSNGIKLPELLLITGTSGPSSKLRTQRKWHSLPRLELRDVLKELNDGDSPLLENQDFFEYIEPIIRNDFRAISHYKYKQREKLELPIMVITGTKEVIKEGEIALWTQESKFPVEFHKLLGGHFFIFDNFEKIINLVENKLLNQNKSRILTL